MKATSGIEFAVVDSPRVPAAKSVGIFGRSVGGRAMAAMIGPSGLDTSLQPHMGRNKSRFSLPQGNGTVITALGLTLTATGTASTASIGTTNIQAAMARINYLVTTAAATAVAGARHNLAQFFRGAAGGKLGGFHLIWRFGPTTGAAADATKRCFVGLTSITAAPTDTEPSTQFANALGVGCDAGDATYQIIHRTATGAAVKIDTGIAKAGADAVEMYEIAIFAPPGGTYVAFTLTRLSDDASFSYTATTSLPAAATLLALQGMYSVGGTSSVIGFVHGGTSLETDY